MNKNNKMRELNMEEYESVNGGFITLPAHISGCLMGVGGYYAGSTILSSSSYSSAGAFWGSISNSIVNKPWQGALYSCGIGAIGGVATQSLVGAAGGGIIGAISQKPGMTALGIGVQQTNPWK